MPPVSVMVASANTALSSARPTPSSASSGLRNTLNAYSVPNGRLSAVAAASAAGARISACRETAELDLLAHRRPDAVGELRFLHHAGAAIDQIAQLELHRLARLAGHHEVRADVEHLRRRAARAAERGVRPGAALALHLALLAGHLAPDAHRLAHR